MSAGEEVDEAITVSGEGVSLRKEFVEDEFTVPTIKFVLENESGDGVEILVTEELPEAFSVDAVGFHPEYGSEHWTCYDDHRAEFQREIPPDTEIETVYGVKIDDMERVDEFLLDPGLAVDGEVVADPVGSVADGQDTSEAEVDKKMLDDDAETGAPSDADGGDDAAVDDEAAVDDDADAKTGVSTNGGTPRDSENGDHDAASLDVDIPGQAATNGDLSLDDPGGTGGSVSDAGGPNAAVPGPETGSVVERLVEELRRNEVDGEQREILREQLDLGVPSETKARLDRLSTRVETVAAYADALEEFLDEEGTAQEVIRDFETQVEALREDVASIREQTGSNASEIGALGEDLGSLESQVDSLEGTLEDVADQADDIEDSLSTTDSQIETVESDLRQAEDQIAETVDDIDDLDHDLSDVEADLSAVDERVTTTEEDVETLDEAAAEIRTDLDDVTEEVADVGTDVDELEEYVADVEDGLDDIREWRNELGEMFQ